MMESISGLEALPLEIINYIAGYLKVEDVLACCSSSSLMRHSFNDDMIWKRFCLFDIISYLKQQECTVKPCDDWFEDELSTLSPLPENRKAFIMQTRLFKNWMSGSYEKEEIEFGPKNMSFFNTCAAFYQSDYLFFHTLLVNENRTIDEIWNVAEVPYLHSTMSLTINQTECEMFSHIGISPDDLNEIEIHMFNIVGNKLLVLKRNLVLIYDMELSHFSRIPLAHAFIFNSPATLMDTCSHVERVVLGNYFIGAIKTNTSLSPSKLYIWNIQTGEKIKEENVASTVSDFSLEILPSSQNNKDLIVKLRMKRDRYMYHYYGYDLEKLEYNTFSVKINYCNFLILANNCAAGVHSERLFLYDYRNSQRILVKKCNQEILKKSLTVVNNNLLFATFDNIVHIISLTTFEMINAVKFGFTLYSLHPVGKYVVINSNNCQVWQIGKTVRKLFQFPNTGSYLAMSDTMTKLAVEKDNKILILNFW